MATTLYFQAASGSCPGMHRGTNSANLQGAAALWIVNGVAIGRGVIAGGSNVSVTSILGPTAGIEIGNTNEYITMPLAAAVTISGTITLNLWSLESSMNANGAVNCIIERLDVTGAVISTIANTARVTETGTTAAAENFTVTPTSTNMLKGERLRFRIYYKDGGGTMASGFILTTAVGGSASGSNGDSFVTFTETLTFLTTDASGTVLYLTTTVGPAVGANDEREMWTSRGGGSTSAIVNTVLGWTAPIQWTGTGGGTALEWYTRQLSGFTLAGLVHLNFRMVCSTAVGCISPRVELAVCNNDGSGAVVWGASSIVSQATPGGVADFVGTNGQGALSTVEQQVIAWLAGSDIVVADGQRLRLRLFIDDASGTAMIASQTATLTYNGTTGGAAGDSWIQLPQSVTELPAITQAAFGFYNEGTETGSTPLVAQDTAYTANIGPGAVSLLVRVRMQSTNASGPLSTDYWVIQYDKNLSGTWFTIFTGGSGVIPNGTSVLTEGQATTNRLTAGTGSFVAGAASKDGTVDNIGWTANNYTELLYALVIQNTSFVVGDVIRLRVVRNGGTTGLTYSQTPQITITGGFAPPWPARIRRFLHLIVR